MSNSARLCVTSNYTPQISDNNPYFKKRTPVRLRTKTVSKTNSFILRIICKILKIKYLSFWHKVVYTTIKTYLTLNNSPQQFNN